jgi:DNA-binding NtrC family response regulator
VDVILLLSAQWPERSLVRAQLAADTDLDVVGADSCESATEWLAGHDFALVVVDTAGLVPDRRLSDALQARGTPVLLLTSAANRSDWTEAVAGLKRLYTMARPVSIGELSVAVARLLHNDAGAADSRDNVC